MPAAETVAQLGGERPLHSRYVDELDQTANGRVEFLLSEVEERGLGLVERHAELGQSGDAPLGFTSEPDCGVCVAFGADDAALERGDAVSLVWHRRLLPMSRPEALLRRRANYSAQPSTEVASSGAGV